MAPRERSFSDIENGEKEEQNAFVELTLNTLKLGSSFDLLSLTKVDLFNCGLSLLPSNLPEILPNLSVLFLTNNNFSILPEVVGRCSNLQMVAFKNNGMKEIHPDALQSQMRWLILTGNQLTELPESIGRCTKLQKLMLSGNLLRELPSSISNLSNLELIRLSCNHLEAPPQRLLQLKSLRWVALSNNPFLEKYCEERKASIELDTSLQVINNPTLDQEDWPVLGKGAGGVTRKVLWDNKDIAVKTYVGELTSDGSPEDERAVSVAASSSKHHCLIQLLGQTPTGALMMEFLDGYDALAGPPSLSTCSRDVYDNALELSWQQVYKTISGLLEVLVQLHAKGICHGDFYAHNILFKRNVEGNNNDSIDIKLSDFGAAFFYDKSAEYAPLVEKVEVRAFGVLVEELKGLLIDQDIDKKSYNLTEMIQSCQSIETPTFAQLLDQWNNPRESMCEVFASGVAVIG